MIQLQYGLGYKPDVLDTRDHDASSSEGQAFIKLRGLQATTPLPESISLQSYVDILDQGQLGSCTANAGAQVLRIREIIEKISGGMTLESAKATTAFASRLFLYYHARAFEGTANADSGAQIRDIWKGLNLFGFPEEKIWPYSDNADPKTGLFSKMPPSYAYRAAYDQRSTGDKSTVDYARISSTGYQRVDDVKTALANNYPVEFGTEVSEQFCSDMSANNGKPIDPPVGLSIAGGHALTIVGYNTNGALIANSWSPDYGLNGFCWFSWDYITWTATSDLWIARRVPLLAAA